MTQEEFEKKIMSDKALQKEFKDNPIKTFKDHSVEISEKDLEAISGGLTMPNPNREDSLINRLIGYIK